MRLIFCDLCTSKYKKETFIFLRFMFGVLSTNVVLNVKTRSFRIFVTRDSSGTQNVNKSLLCLALSLGYSYTDIYKCN